jgi:hypothetical protein
MSTPEDGDTRELEIEPPPDADADADLDAVEEVEEVEPPELSLAFSPRQILGGFALLAAIVVWLFRRRGKGG